MIRIDLNTRIVPPSAQIWIVQAGVGKKYTDLFRAEKKIFLDLPNLDLSFQDDLRTSLVRRKIKRSKEWREYLLQILAGGGDGIPKPKLDIDSYTDDPLDKGISNLHASVNALFFVAKVGDLILVPTGHGQFGNLMMGEVLEDFDPAQRISVNGSEAYSVQFRSVHWLSAMPQKRTLSDALAKRIFNRRAAVAIDRNQFGREIYSFAYENFDDGRVSKATLYGSRYSGKDMRDLLEAINIISWLVSAFFAIEAGDINSINSENTEEFIANYYQKEGIENLKVSFSSPGGFTIFTRRRAVSIFVAAAIPVLLNLPIEKIAQSVSLHIINEGKPVSGDAELESTYALKGLVQSLAPQRRRALRDTTERAVEAVGLHTASEVSIVPDPPPQPSIRPE